MKIITFSSLYPNTEQPRHGIFVEERLKNLVRSGEVEARVVAPVPWFPSTDARFGRYAEWARIPHTQTRNGLTVEYPRYPVIPKVGMTLAPLLMAAALLGPVRRLRDSFGPDVVLDGHYLYPDGVVAAWIARRLGLPVILTARGSDVAVLPQYRAPRVMIQWAVRQASRVITVSEALRGQLITLGAEPGKVIALRNGVDPNRFYPVDREAARERVGLSGTTLLSVGNLLECKGYELVIETLPALKGVNYCIVGDGPLGSQLRKLAQDLGVDKRVTFIGNVPQEQLIDYYSAADALVLPSLHEGMPNVVLESLACGTPVIATRCEGVPELLTTPAAGELMRQRNQQGLIEAYGRLMANYPQRDKTRAHAETLGWEPTIASLLTVIREAGSESGYS